MLISKHQARCLDSGIERLFWSYQHIRSWSVLSSWGWQSIVLCLTCEKSREEGWVIKPRNHFVGELIALSACTIPLYVCTQVSFSHVLYQCLCRYLCPAMINCLWNVCVCVYPQLRLLQYMPYYWQSLSDTLSHVCSKSDLWPETFVVESFFWKHVLHFFHYYYLKKDAA